MDDTEGSIGFNGVDDKWIEHQETYEDILSELNSGAAPEEGSPKLTSIEQRSRSLRGRVHYSKFLRGKDLSQKKEEDLKAIVINRKKGKACSDDDEGNDVEHEHSDDTMHPLTYTSNISYQEYFAQRMKHKKEAAAYTPGSSEVANAERVGLAPKDKGVEERHDPGKKQKERRKESKKQSTEIPSDARLLQDGEDSTETEEGSSKRKHSKRCKQPYEESGMRNGEVCGVVDVEGIGAGGNILKAEHKAKKAKKKGNGSGSGGSKSPEETEESDKGTASTKKKKKAQNGDSSSTAEDGMVLQAEDDKQEEVESLDRKRKKRKSGCAGNEGSAGEGSEDPATTVDRVADAENAVEDAVSAKKKKKSNGVSLATAENGVVLRREDDKQEEVKSPDKKHRSVCAYSEGSADEGGKNPATTADGVTEAKEVPAKKKKKSKKGVSLSSVENGMASQAEDDKQEEVESLDKKRKKRKSGRASDEGSAGEAVENPAMTVDEVAEAKEVSTEIKSKSQKVIRPDSTEDGLVLQAEGTVQDKDKKSDKKSKKHKRSKSQEGARSDTENETVLTAEHNVLKGNESPVKKRKLRGEDVGGCQEEVEQKNQTKAPTVGDDMRTQDKITTDSTEKEKLKNADTLSVERPIKEEAGSSDRPPDKVPSEDTKKGLMNNTSFKEDSGAASCVEKVAETSASKKKKCKVSHAKENVETSKDVEGSDKKEKRKWKTEIETEVPVQRGNDTAADPQVNSATVEVSQNVCPTGKAEEYSSSTDEKHRVLDGEGTSKSDRDSVTCEDASPRKKKVKVGVSAKRKILKSKTSKQDNPATLEAIKKLQRLQVELQNVLQQLTGGTENEGKRVPGAVKTQKEGTKKKKVAGTTTVAKKVATKVEAEAEAKHETCRKRKLAPDADGTKRKVAKRKNVAESETVVKRARTKAKNETTSSESKVEGERQDAEAERQTHTGENCSDNNTPVSECEDLHYARQIVYSNNVKQERFKLRPGRYLYYLTRDLRTVYRNTNLKDIPGYASQEWMKQCTMLFARSLHGMATEGKSQPDV
ncbi:uncharacterized protein LOC135391106 isoform X2 [Ornithodoros turicata]|uniref:uncharacterized protein LOC135391106 isoform X2 n=1 Tax=Ornithodoros turicata TaxID=34597 RepID=UPI0031391C63